MSLQDKLRFRDIFSAVNDAIFIVDPNESRIVDVNNEAVKMLGYEREELLGMHIEKIHPTEMEQLKNTVKEVLLGHPVVTDEFSCLRKDKHRVPADISFSQVQLNEKTYVMAMVRDITERKRVEAEIVRLAKFPAENPNPVLRISRHGVIIYSNKASSLLLSAWQYRAGQPLSGHWHQFVVDTFSLGTPREAEVECGDRIFSLAFAPVADSDYLNVYALDITERKRAEQKLEEYQSHLERLVDERTVELRLANEALQLEVSKRRQAEQTIQESEEHFRSVVGTAKDAIISIDGNGKIIFWNIASEDIFGYSADEAVGKSVALVLPKQFHETHQKGLNQAVKMGETNLIGKTVELVGLKKDGSEFPLELSLSTWKVTKGVFFTAVIRDATKRKQMENKLQAMSITDDLTGLHNRRGFYNLIDYLLKQAKRQKQGMFLLYTDLDDLKEINDRFGHKEGDNALIDFANILKTNFRESNVIARLGGDEFAVIPVGFTGDNIDIIKARLQERLDTFNVKSNRRYKLSVSVGIAYCDPEYPCSVDELLTQADKLMYEQKRKTNKS